MNTYTGRTKKQKRFEKREQVKRAVLKQTAFCAAAVLSAIALKESFFTDDSFLKKAICFTLSENTDFKQRYTDIKAFFADKIRMTGLLTDYAEVDPVKNMKAPVLGTVYRHFGLKKDELSGEENFCYGTKILTSENEKVISSSNGETAETGFSTDYGNYILIKHSEKIYTLYSGLNEILPSSGDKVKAGQVIATVGINEKEKKPILYFELREGDSFLDPEAFIAFEKNTGDEND